MARLGFNPRHTPGLHAKEIRETAGKTAYMTKVTETLLEKAKKSDHKKLTDEEKRAHIVAVGTLEDWMKVLKSGLPPAEDALRKIEDDFSRGVTDTYAAVIHKASTGGRRRKTRKPNRKSRSTRRR
jgi:hypothetical protein